MRKRGGNLDFFNPEKITDAMRRAFVAVRGSADEPTLRKLTNNVTNYLEQMRGKDGIVSVEQTQNIVERALMEDNCFDVSKAYIIYRYEHAKTREKKAETPAEEIESDEKQVKAVEVKTRLDSADKLDKDAAEIIVKINKKDPRLSELLDLLESKQIISAAEKQKILVKDSLVQVS